MRAKDFENDFFYFVMTAYDLLSLFRKGKQKQNIYFYIGGAVGEGFSAIPVRFKRISTINTTNLIVS